MRLLYYYAPLNFLSSINIWSLFSVFTKQVINSSSGHRRICLTKYGLVLLIYLDTDFSFISKYKILHQRSCVPPLFRSSFLHKRSDFKTEVPQNQQLIIKQTNPFQQRPSKPKKCYFNKLQLLLLYVYRYNSVD